MPIPTFRAGKKRLVRGSDLLSLNEGDLKDAIRGLLRQVDADAEQRNPKAGDNQ